MTYRVKKRFLPRAESLLAPPLARVYRPFLRRTRFIAVTGSCGKTMAKELIANILARAEPTHRSFDSNNTFAAIARTVLELRPRHRNCVMELGASGPGSLLPSIALLKPQVAVVTAIGKDHYKAFRGASAAASEKQRLVAAIPENGIAILNRSDPLVMQMASDCRGRVISYGLEKDADVRGVIVAWRWPERLTLDVTYREQTARVATRLLGPYLATPVLAALATGVACGVPLAEAAQAVAETPAFAGRMEIVPARGDVTFIHDQFKAPLWTMNAVVDYLGSANAKRTVLVVGTISDYGGSTSPKYRRLAEYALERIDHVIFATPLAPKILRKVKAAYPDRLHLFPDARAAAGFVAELARPDDLVLLKGSLRADHLERISMHYQQTIRCWRQKCGREIFCSDCDLRDVPEQDERVAGHAEQISSSGMTP